VCGGQAGRRRAGVKTKRIVHISETEMHRESGMGRVACHWRDEFERRGHEFVHIGPSAAGPMMHPALFPYRAWRAYARLHRPASTFLVHEPASGVFVKRGIPLAVFSHGVERRHWQQSISDPTGAEGRVSLKERLTVPVRRLRHCDKGIRHAEFILAESRQDQAFIQRYYGRSESEVFPFRNGIEPLDIEASLEPEAFTVLFNGTWILRKGIAALSQAAQLLHDRGVPVKWVLAATQFSAETVLKSWPSALRADTRIIPTYPSDHEARLLAEASVFVLPSVFEGQPLSLLQAMAAARCCITTDCCGQRDLIHHQQNGLLMPIGDAPLLARHVERCFHDKAGRQRLGAAAKTSVQGRLWTSVAGEIVDRVLAL
jgi:glycosyltransferase involved in cell wall biosynthesis